MTSSHSSTSSSPSPHFHSGAPASLRNVYAEPSSVWTFSPAPKGSPPSSGDVSGGSNSKIIVNPTYTHAYSGSGAESGSSFRWSNKPPHNSIFDLSRANGSPSNGSSSIRNTFRGGNVGDRFGGVNATQVMKTIVASAVLQYSSSAIAMPWEVGKTLLQVQWVPRDAKDIGELELEDEEIEGALPEEKGEGEGDFEDTYSEGSAENEAYFADPSMVSQKKLGPPRVVDENGYLVRKSVLEEGTRPEFIIPVGIADGVWQMIKQVTGFPTEGWLALWKGKDLWLLTSCLSEIISSTMQPFIHQFIQSIFLPNLSPFHQPPIFLPIISHLLTGFVLSPLDLIRTRLIVQSHSLRYRTYTGPIDALSQILRDEGGLKGIYFHPHLFIPTVLENTIRPLVSLTLPGILAAQIGSNISENTHPISWSLAEFAGSCLGLLVTLPLETARRRLQIQARGSAKPLRACVEVRPLPYTGVSDVIYRVLTEERSDLPIRRRRKRIGQVEEKEKGGNEKDRGKNDDNEVVDSWLRYIGIGQLYRGLSAKLGASALVFALGLVSGGEEADGGWAEI